MLPRLALGTADSYSSVGWCRQELSADFLHTVCSDISSNVVPIFVFEQNGEAGRSSEGGESGVKESGVGGV
ncbi:hypothetical protein CEXT_96891 [Caerostris extrusa]|uniref:Uncharacterized protein n=1 Tax=Caerostris extrusa TaxID=172846 RepID=A0AAV4NPX2_CAEEX|nr:hypothetical protein CEXT_96891 [Caerostris extrusa]